MVTVVSTAVLIPVEKRAAEPVLPMSLFSSRVFTVAGAIGFIVGFALFGATTYLPLFLQIVTGASPTRSGLELLPLILGLLVTSIGSGQIIARWGHYRPFPIAGTAIMVVGFWRLSTMEPSTSALERSLDMVILGLGIGLVMQVLVLAVQNDVDYRNLGVATSGTTFFRSIGGCFGVAICGAIFSNRLAAELSKLSGLPPSVGAGRVTRDMVAQLPPAARAAFVGAYADALTTVFAVCAPIAAVAFVLSWLLPERPLRRTVEATGVGEAFAAPKHDDPALEIERALSTLARRDSRERILERLCAAGGPRPHGAPVLGPGARGRARADGRLRHRRRALRSTRRGWRRASPSCASSATSTARARRSCSPPPAATRSSASSRPVASAWPSCSTAGRPSARPTSPALLDADGARRRRRPSRRRSAARARAAPRHRTGRRFGLYGRAEGAPRGCRLPSTGWRSDCPRSWPSAVAGSRWTPATRCWTGTSSG